MVDTTLSCPNCDLLCPPGTSACDCGYSFLTGAYPVTGRPAGPTTRRVFQFVLGSLIGPVAVAFLGVHEGSSDAFVVSSASAGLLLGAVNLWRSRLGLWSGPLAVIVYSLLVVPVLWMLAALRACPSCMG